MEESDKECPWNINVMTVKQFVVLSPTKQGRLLQAPLLLKDTANANVAASQ